MGGGDKTLRPLGAGTILSHVVDRLRPQAHQIAISANSDPARFAAFGLPVLADRGDSYAGPLAGILAGMEWATSAGGTHIGSHRRKARPDCGGFEWRQAASGFRGLAAAARRRSAALS
jgi:hypothetical protein